MVLFALSLDLILGYAGIVTLGHAAFFGLGAYAVGLLTQRCGWGEPISGLVAAAARRGRRRLRVGLVAAALPRADAAGADAGHHHPAAGARQLLSRDLTGGYDGIPGITISPLFGRFDYDLYGHVYYLYALAVLFVVFFVVRRIVYSPFGAGADRHPRERARACMRSARRCTGVWSSPTRSRPRSPASPARCSRRPTRYATLGVFDFDRSAGVMVMLILGGTGRLYGAFAGAVIYMMLRGQRDQAEPAILAVRHRPPAGAHGPVRAPRPARPVRGRRRGCSRRSRSHDRAGARDPRTSTMNFGALRVTRDVNLTLRARRAPRADRPERRRQDHARQPDHRRAQARPPGRCCSTARTSRRCRRRRARAAASPARSRSTSCSAG